MSLHAQFQQFRCECWVEGGGLGSFGLGVLGVWILFLGRFLAEIWGFVGVFVSGVSEGNLQRAVSQCRPFAPSFLSIATTKQSPMPAVLEAITTVLRFRPAPVSSSHHQKQSPTSARRVPQKQVRRAVRCSKPHNPSWGVRQAPPIRTAQGDRLTQGQEMHYQNFGAGTSRAA